MRAVREKEHLNAPRAVLPEPGLDTRSGPRPFSQSPARLGLDSIAPGVLGILDGGISLGTTSRAGLAARAGLGLGATAGFRGSHLGLGQNLAGKARCPPEAPEWPPTASQSDAEPPNAYSPSHDSLTPDSLSLWGAPGMGAPHGGACDISHRATSPRRAYCNPRGAREPCSLASRSEGIPRAAPAYHP